MIMYTTLLSTVYATALQLQLNALCPVSRSETQLSADTPATVAPPDHSLLLPLEQGPARSVQKPPVLSPQTLS